MIDDFIKSCFCSGKVDANKLIAAKPVLQKKSNNSQMNDQFYGRIYSKKHRIEKDTTKRSSERIEKALVQI